MVIARDSDRYRLAIKEALLILKNSPLINRQFHNFTNILKLHNHRVPTSSQQATRVGKNSSIPNPVLPLISHSQLRETPSDFEYPDLFLQENTCSQQHLELQNVPLYTDNVEVGSHKEAPHLSIAVNTTSSSSQSMIPDMHEVLHCFGINPSHLKTVPLAQYHWREFDHPNIDSDTTISQRIRTLIRNTRKEKNNDSLREGLGY